MKVKDFDDFGRPNRRPGLIILLVIAVSIGVIYYIRQHRPRVEPTDITTVTTTVPDSNARDLPRPPVSTTRPHIPASETVKQKLARAQSLQKDGSLLPARELYYQIFETTRDQHVLTAVRGALSLINTKVLLSPLQAPEKVEYTIRPGDTVDVIAKKHSTTKELIAASNGIKNIHRIRAGQELRLVKGSFSGVVSKTGFTLDLLLDGRFMKQYPIGIGKFNKTPIGTFKVTDRIVDPTWWPPDGREIPPGDPANLLGTRWMALAATGDTPEYSGYGIHGTTQPDTIGKAESAGCIRMKNSHVEELYLFLPIGTQISITE